MNVNIETLKYYIEHAQISLDKLKESIPNIELFLSGERSLTFNQVSEVAKKLNIPTGLLLLENPIEVKSKKLEFRTIDSTAMQAMSEELRDTILEMEGKQAFLREEIDFTLDFIGSCSINDDVSKVASIVRNKLQITEFFQGNINKSDVFKFLQEKINNIGVFVFLNGKVGDNTHRPLSLDEFRGFVLVDDKAPIIFINQKDDSIGGKLFTLVHELVHLFIGTNEILTNEEINNYFHNPVEVFVNKVTAEILVPANIFCAALKIASKNIDEKIQSLADKFKVSKFVIVRRLYDLNDIDHSVYLSKTEELNELFKEFQRRKKSSGGGSYNNNLKFRIDRRFFNYVQQAVNQNRISYTEAFRIIGVSYKGYKTLAESK